MSNHQKTLLRIALFFTILFLFLTVILKEYQLLGMNDSGFYLNLINNFFHYGSTSAVQGCGTLERSYFGYHFSPIWLLFSPFLIFINDPIVLLYFINYIGYLFWFTTLFYIVAKHLKISINLIIIIKFFILFFSSITVLFNYFLNYNGIHEVLFAIGFLNFAFYVLLIKKEYNKAFFWFLPTLLVKEEFWLIFIFFNFIIYIQSKEKRFLLATFISLALFYLLYFKYMPSLLEGFGQAIIHGSYNYIFNSGSIGELIDNIIALPAQKQKLFQIFSFFIPFIILVDFKKITKIDWLILIFAIGPTIGYSYLSRHIGQSNFLFDHYSMPIISVVSIFVLKYLKYSKTRIFFYFLVNAILILFVLYMKQGWQYRYYQDEQQIKKIIAEIDFNKSKRVVTDDRTGIYFSFYNSDYLSDRGLTGCQLNKEAEYFVINTRYLYLTSNKKFSVSEEKYNSYDYLKRYGLLDNNSYKIIYLTYPFIVLKKDEDKRDSLIADRKKLNEWDLITDGKY